MHVWYRSTEELDEQLIAARRLLEPAPDNEPEIVASGVSDHERRVDGRPERFAMFDHAVEHGLDRRTLFGAGYDR